MENTRRNLPPALNQVLALRAAVKTVLANADQREIIELDGTAITISNYPEGRTTANGRELSSITVRQQVGAHGLLSSVLDYRLIEDMEPTGGDDMPIIILKQPPRLVKHEAGSSDSPVTADEITMLQLAVEQVFTNTSSLPVD